MQNSSHFVKSLIAPLLSLALVVASYAPFLTFISLRLQLEGFSESIIGFTHSAFFFGFLIGSIKAEKFIKRIGYIRSFATFASLYGTTMLMQGIFVNPYFWIAVRFIAGISIAALYVVIESWLLSESSHKTRGRILSIYMIILYASQSFSQLFLKAIDPTTSSAFLLFGFLCCLSIIPVSINYRPPPKTDGEGIKTSFRQVYKSAPFSIWGALISGLILSAVYSFVPVFAEVKGISVSYIMFITIGGGFILQWPIGHISDMFDRRVVLIIISFCLIIPALLTMIYAHSTLLVYILSFLLGGFSFTIYPISITQACDRFDTPYLPYVIGIASLSYGIGAMIGPIISSYAMQINVDYLYLYVSACALLLGLIGTYFRIRHPRVIPPDEKTEYLPLPGSMPLGSELDPRTHEDVVVIKEKATPPQDNKNE